MIRSFFKKSGASVFLFHMEPFFLEKRPTEMIMQKPLKKFHLVQLKEPIGTLDDEMSVRFHASAGLYGY